MHSKKGFVSFYVLSLFSYLLLSLQFQTALPASISPTLDIKSSYQTHIFLKRSFEPAAKHALDSTNQKLILLGNGPVQFVFAGHVVLISSRSNSPSKDDLIRLAILSEFHSITTEYSRLSNFESVFYCDGRAPLPYPTLPSSVSDTQIKRLWNDCSSNVQIIHSINQTRVSVSGLNVRTINSITNTLMDSPLESFEVGG